MTARARRIVLGIISTLLVATAIAVLGSDTSQAHRCIKDLAKASTHLECRPVEARLSGPFPYRPPHTELRGDARAAEHSQWRVDEEAQRIAAAAAEDSRPEMLHAAGVAALCTNDIALAVKKLDETILKETGERQIGIAIERSNNEDLLIDLAAAYIALWANDRSLGRLLNAFAAAERATRIDDRSVPALFNRAVALQALGLRAEAAKAWESYLIVDAGSDWSNEARHHLSLLSSRQEPWSAHATALIRSGCPAAAVSDPQRARGFAENTLLPEWGALVLTGERANAAAALGKAELIATHVRDVSRDTMLQESVERLSHVEDLSAAARAHVAYGRAIQAFKRSPNDEAIVALRTAGDALRAAHSPLALRAAMYAETATQYSGRNAQVIAETAALLREVKDKADDYPSITGQLHWVAGLASFSLGQYESALDHYREARRHFLRCGDLSNVAGIATVTAECLRVLGYDDEAWQEMLTAADLAYSNVTPQRRYVVLSATTRLAAERRYLGIARLFGEEMRASAKESGDAALEADAFLTLAELFRINGDPGSASRAVDDAERVVPAIQTRGLRNRALCRAALEKAHALAFSSPREALVILSSAARLSQDIQLSIFKPEIHLLASDAYRALHRLNDAQSELLRGLQEYRAQSPKAGTVDHATFARLGRELSDRYIALTADHDEPAAWSAALADREYANGAVRIGATDALLVYRVLPDETLIWIVRKGQRHLVRQQIAASDVESDVDALVQTVQKASSLVGVRAAAEHAFDLFVRPALPYVAGSSRLWIMADSALVDLPFTVLIDRVGERLLIDQWEVTLVDATPHLANPVALPERLDAARLIVAAAPNVPTLAPLDGARDEAHQIGRAWANATVRIGDDATPSEFLSDALRNEIVHFAGHITHHFDPGSVALRFSPSANGDGRVSAADLEKLAEHPPALVVLSACGSALGRSSASGPLSLTRPLFKSGVAAVIASLWDVEDGATAPLMLRFYDNLRAAERPGQALRNAQLSLAHLPGPPRRWAVFQLYVNQELF